MKCCGCAGGGARIRSAEHRRPKSRGHVASIYTAPPEDWKNSAKACFRLNPQISKLASCEALRFPVWTMAVSLTTHNDLSGGHRWMRTRYNLGNTALDSGKLVSAAIDLDDIKTARAESAKTKSVVSSLGILMSRAGTQYEAKDSRQPHVPRGGGHLPKHSRRI